MLKTKSPLILSLQSISSGLCQAIPLLILYFSLSSTTFAQETGPPNTQVKIPLNNWSSQRIISLALGQILSKYHYKVEFRNINSDDQWGALIRGVIHFQIEVWQPSMEGKFKEMIKRNVIVDLGSHRAKAREDWWYPDYVEPLCPGLPDWQALKRCSAIFATGTNKKGVYHTGPWSYRDPELIRSLALNFTVNRLENSQALNRILNNALEHKKPIVMLNWSPNWIDNRIPGKYVEFPTFSKVCESDPLWGPNPEMTYDCGNIKDAWIKKVAWVKLEQQLPCVYQFIKNVDLTTSMISEAAALVDQDGYTEDHAAKRWLLKYAEQSQQWQNISCLHSKKLTGS